MLPCPGYCCPGYCCPGYCCPARLLPRLLLLTVGLVGVTTSMAKQYAVLVPLGYDVIGSSVANGVTDCLLAHAQKGKGGISGLQASVSETGMQLPRGVDMTRTWFHSSAGQLEPLTLNRDVNQNESSSWMIGCRAAPAADVRRVPQTSMVVLPLERVHVSKPETTFEPP